MSYYIDLEKDTCNFYFEKNGTDVWGTCLFTLSPDLDGWFSVQVENVVAYIDAGETEIPYKLTDDETYKLCGEIEEEASNQMLWEERLREIQDDNTNDNIEQWKSDKWN